MSNPFPTPLLQLRRGTKTRFEEDLPAEARRALAQLRKASAYARDLQVDPWEFAVRLTHLVDLGVGESDLRWLVLNGYVSHADELTTPSDHARRFRLSENLAFSGQTCFVLTEAGAQIAGHGTETAETPAGRSSDAPRIVSLGSRVPQWDRKLRVLRFDDFVVKRFRLPAGNQEAVLSAFEAEGWPSSIDDPLSCPPTGRPKERLHATIRCLNANQENRLLRFRGNGTGQAVLWEPTAASAVDRPTLPLALRRAA